MNDKRNSRRIVERIVVKGDLILKTPAHFGNGEGDPFVDLPLSLDAYDARPIITGTSHAGALRNALTERLAGYGKEVDGADSPVVKLFGARREKEDDRQSALIVEDALAVDEDKTPAIELRDGVAIMPDTGTARPDFKYDLELLPAGTRFETGFELLVPEGEGDLLRTHFAAALEELAAGEIYLGARKRRGFGECGVTHWKVWRYNLRTAAGLKGSLAHDHPEWRGAIQPRAGSDITALLDVAGPVAALDDNRQYFEVSGTFRLPGDLLIRSGFESLTGPDTMHLLSQRGGAKAPVIAGTSLAGVMRGRALKIAQTLGLAEAAELVNGLFGYLVEKRHGGRETEKQVKASRLQVYERVIETKAPEWVQQRVRIDRWTGGALDTGLFAEAPVTGGTVELAARIRNPAEREVALLIHIWKDLWTGDLPIGGEAGVSRGQLRGERGNIRWREHGQTKTWTLAENGTLQNASGEERRRFDECRLALAGEAAP